MFLDSPFGRRCAVLHVTAGKAEFPADVEHSKAASTFSVEYASTAAEAFHILSTRTNATRPNLIVVEYGLPDATGIDFLGAIKRSDVLRRLPVIMLVAGYVPREVDALYAAGAACVLDEGPDEHAKRQLLAAIQYFWTKCAVLPYGEVRQE